MTGYVHHTIPICLHAWLRSPYDFRRVVGDVVSLGGDADTTGAIAGALAGGTVSASNIPADWLAISDWPRSLTWIRMLGERVARRGTPLRIWWPVIPLRNDRVRRDRSRDWATADAAALRMNGLVDLGRTSVAAGAGTET